jgi:hypothetical protein
MTPPERIIPVEKRKNIDVPCARMKTRVDFSSAKLVD